MKYKAKCSEWQKKKETEKTEKKKAQQQNVHWFRYLGGMYIYFYKMYPGTLYIYSKYRYIIHK